MRHAEIRPYRGAPTLFVDGAPHSGAMYTTWRVEERFIREMAGAGVRLFAIDTTCGCHYYRICAQAWNGPGEFDFSDLDRRIRVIVNICPEALLLLRVYVGSPTFWDLSHPDELMRDADGRPVTEPVDFAYLGGIDPGFGPPKETVPSFSSTVWRRAAREALCEYVRHVESTFGQAVVGYLLETGGTEEWYYWGAFQGIAADYSEPQRRGFGREIPRPEARRTTTRGSFFRDPGAEGEVIAYGQYHNAVVAQTLLDWAGAVKAETERHKLVGAFYGYAYDLCRAPHVWPESGHLCLADVLDSPDVDFLVSPTSYMDRRVGDGVCLLGGPAASVAMHGKLFWNENDQYTHLTPKTGSSFYLRANSPRESALAHRREIAASICQGVPQWWFDMHGGWFSGDGLLSEIALERAVLERAVSSDRDGVAEIALVLDYQSPLYTESDNRLYHWLIRDTACRLAKIGAPFDVLLLSDLERARDYRLLVLPNAFRLGAKAHTERRHALYLYAPGYLGSGASAVTDMTVVARAPGGVLRARAADTEFGPGFAIEPQLVIKGDAEPLAFYTDRPDEIAMAAKGSSVFAAVPGLPAEVLRKVARRAGVHIYADGPHQVWACRDWLALSCGGDGPHEIALRAPGTVEEAFTGKRLSTDSRATLRVDAAKGDVVLFRHV